MEICYDQGTEIEELLNAANTLVRRSAEVSVSIQKHHASVMDTLHVRMVCAHCMRAFTLWDSLGRLECKVHPGLFSLDKQAWQCCGKQSVSWKRPETYESPFRTQGCHLADHRLSNAEPQSLTYGAQFELPLLVFVLLPRFMDRAVKHVRYRPWGDSMTHEFSAASTVAPSHTETLRQFQMSVKTLDADHDAAAATKTWSGPRPSSERAAEEERRRHGHHPLSMVGDPTISSVVDIPLSPDPTDLDTVDLADCAVILTRIMKS